MKKNLIFQFILYLLVFVLISYVYILTKENFASSIDFKSQLSNDEAKINIKQFVLDETKADQLSWKLNSEHASLFDKSNIINLENNKLYIFQDNTTYTIKSDKGIYDIEKKIIKLNDNVSVSSEEDFIFYTEELFYFIEEKKIESYSKVFAKHFHNNIKINGNNLTGNIQLKDFSINKDVVLESDNDALNIKSNRVDFFTKSKKIVFYDKVRAIKKDIIIFCNKMDIYYNKEGYQEMHAFENVKILIDSDKKAFSKFAKVDNKNIVLKDQAKFKINNDEFKGDEIIYNLNTKDIEINNAEGFIKKMDNL